MYEHTILLCEIYILQSLSVYFFQENLALWPSVFPWWLIDRNICWMNLTMLFSLRSLANNKLKALPRDSFIDLDSLIELWVVMHVHSMCCDSFFNCIKKYMITFRITSTKVVFKERLEGQVFTFFFNQISIFLCKWNVIEGEVETYPKLRITSSLFLWSMGVLKKCEQRLQKNPNMAF